MGRRGSGNLEAAKKKKHAHKKLRAKRNKRQGSEKKGTEKKGRTKFLQLKRKKRGWQKNPESLEPRQQGGKTNSDFNEESRNVSTMGGGYDS